MNRFSNNILFILSISALISMTMSSCKQTQSKSEIVLENIASRKSVRSYTSETVPEEMVEKLLRAAMAAPSAMNRQPWEFVVIRDRSTLDTLAAQLKFAKMLYEAPLAIVVCSDTEYTRTDGIRAYNKFWQQDAAAAAQNILLAAESLGLGAVWTAASDDVRSAVVREVLGIEGTVMPVCVIPIGFPAGDEKPMNKWKPEKIHYEKW